jgi:putative RNA 2'-phosphotransferase
MDDCGWVDVNDLISLCDPPNDNKDEILRIIENAVVNDKKGRYEILGDKIRATNGHSVSLCNTIMTPITSKNKFSWVVHGTSEESWELIQKSGCLKKMTRDYIHFAIKDTHLRNKSQVQIYLYLLVDKLLNDGYKLFQTTNSVIGSFEDIPLKYLYVGDRP